MSAIDVLRERIEETAIDGDEVIVPRGVAILISAEYAALELFSQRELLPGLLEKNA